MGREGKVLWTGLDLWIFFKLVENYRVSTQLVAPRVMSIFIELVS
jgi:hypothetical protein